MASLSPFFEILIIGVSDGVRNGCLCYISAPPFCRVAKAERFNSNEFFSKMDRFRLGWWHVPTQGDQVDHLGHTPPTKVINIPSVAQGSNLIPLSDQETHLAPTTAVHRVGVLLDIIIR